MDAEYAIVADPARVLLRVTMRGFFTQEDVGDFVAAMTAKLDWLRCAPNMHLTLCDVSAMKIQSQEIVAAFTKVVGSPKLRSRRLAFVTGSSLSRMQTRRLTNREGVEFFGDLASAEAWLLAEDVGPSQRSA